MGQKKQRQAPKVDVATENFLKGYNAVCSHPLFRTLSLYVDVQRHNDNGVPRNGWVLSGSNGVLRAHPTRRGESAEWAYVLAHAFLHLAFGHFRQNMTAEWQTACDCVVARFLHDIKFGTPPVEMIPPHSGLPAMPAREEEALEARFHADGIPRNLHLLGSAGELPDMIWVEAPTSLYLKPPDWPALFAQGLNEAVSSAVYKAAGYDTEAREKHKTASHRARGWFVSSFPLLGALAASFEIVEDAYICGRESISVAAINVRTRTIFMNPAAGLNEEQCKFVMAHEFLHAGLRHDARRGGRDPYLWNVACDFVINGWLLEMGVGEPPALGMLYDPELRGLSAESIYDRIVKDMRRYRKLCTLRGFGQSDILEDENREWWRVGEGTTLDAWYRSALAQGLAYHEQQGRGFLPSGLIEEIRALEMPAIPWDVELARWFDHYFPPIEKRRSYARLSRRQSSTPDIPRPSWATPEELYEDRTFGVVLDTSGSMDRTLLAMALGSIASYSMSRDVRVVRVVFCDAVAYDAGYMPPEEIAGRVKVRGRGGTVLQPAVDLLQEARDFPESGPVLVITDGYCDHVRLRREHAFLVPHGHRLPFAPRGPVFYFR